MTIIEAPRDYATLERYLPAFIEMCASAAESAMAARRRELRRASAVNPERFNDSTTWRSALRIPHCFEMWILHLGELDALAGAAAFTLDDLTAEEARGLAILRRVREKFWEEHTRCPNCGTVNPRHASFCAGCGHHGMETSGFRFQEIANHKPEV